jgi:hypothetical protein
MAEAARLALALFAFALPGVGCAVWLERRGRLTLLCAPLGFAASLALFGAVAWPFLWYRRTLGELRATLVVVWSAWALIGLYAFSRRRARDEPDAVGDEREETPLPWPLLAGVLAIVGAVAWTVWAAIWIHDHGGAERAVHATLAALPVELALLAVLVWRLRATTKTAAASLAPTLQAPRAAVLVATALVALQAASAAVYARPDWDDGYYLAAALDFAQAPVLDAEEPTHREGFRVQPHQRLLVWELLGAVLCRLSGVAVPVLFHTVWPPLLVLLAYAAYAGLFAELVPRRQVGLAVIGLSGVMLWGISSQWSAASFFLPRLWQGKAIALHLWVPLASAFLLRAARRPSARNAVALVVAVGAGLAASLSAIFLLLALLVSLAAALAWSAAGRRAPLVATAVAGALPLLVVGLALRERVGAGAAVTVVPPEQDAWWKLVSHYVGTGVAFEIAWILTLPLCALVVRERRARAYLLGLPAALAVGLAGPLLYHPVARSFTSYHTYERLFWLYPVGTGLAVLLARLAGRQAAASPRAERIALVLALGGVLSWLALPSLYVWGARNDFLGPLGAPRLAENLEKTPPGLRTIAARLAAQPDARTTRILCNEEAASFLTSSSRALRFVQTRRLYTVPMLAAEGRPAEGLERHRLAAWLRGEEAAPDVDLLLDRYRVGWAISIAEDRGAAELGRHGFRAVWRDDRFTLWQRDSMGR